MYNKSNHQLILTQNHYNNLIYSLDKLGALRIGFVFERNSGATLAEED